MSKLLLGRNAHTSRPARNVSTGYVPPRRKINFKKIPFMNGVTKSLADLDSVPLDHKLYALEGIRSIPCSIAPIYLSKNIFEERFGEKLVVFFTVGLYIVNARVFTKILGNTLFYLIL